MEKSVFAHKLAQAERKEDDRQRREHQAMEDLHETTGTLKTMHKVVLSIQNLDDPKPIHGFNEKLAGAMNAYESALVLDKKAAMTDEEKNSAIERNAHSEKVAEDNLKVAVARGEKNQ
jgi:hypothetical protein